jgi:hypothetical protein
MGTRFWLTIAQHRQSSITWSALPLVEQMQHRYDRLLDMPRTPPPPSPQEAPGHAQEPSLPPTHARSQDPPQRPPGPAFTDERGEMRRAILTLLQDAPQGLTPRQHQRRLGIERSLTDTCYAMARDGLLQRVGHGIYRTPASPDHHTPEGS